MPDQTVFYAIGDVHGEIARLKELHAAILDFHRATHADLPMKLIHLGDYIDRGPDSAGVIELLMELDADDSVDTVNLRGNHEQMMIDFIDDPAGKGARWLSFGGIETLASFGIEVEGKRLDAEDALDTADALESAMPPGMLDWLRALPVVAPYSWAFSRIALPTSSSSSVTMGPPPTLVEYALKTPTTPSMDWGGMPTPASAPPMDGDDDGTNGDVPWSISSIAPCAPSSSSASPLDRAS